mgnify:CR=1 FL=1
MRHFDQVGLWFVVPEEEETEEDSKPSEQFEPAELNGVWVKTRSFEWD